MSATSEKPNILVICIDQWDVHMELPPEVELPNVRRLQSLGVTLEKQYCTTPICTPSRSTMWTGQHATKTGMWNNTGFAWINDMSTDIPTIGHMMREQGYYTAFKGKWHLSALPKSESALEPYGFGDYQQWGDPIGTPLEGAKLDGTVAFETADWLKYKAPSDQPWLLISSFVNPHDIMFLRTHEDETTHPNGSMRSRMHYAQQLGFMKEFDVTLPDNFDDDLNQQPYGVKSYKQSIEWNYGKIPEDRHELWLDRRNYLINCMRMVDLQIGKVLEELDRKDLWKSTVVILTSDHGEMNGAHRLAQKGGIHFEEATVVNMTAVMPAGPQGARTGAVGSHMDLAPTLLNLAGLSEDEIRQHYPQLTGQSMRESFANPEEAKGRGTVHEPGVGALITWDGLSQLDPEWAIKGGLKHLRRLPADHQVRAEKMREVGAKYGAPDFSKRTFFRGIIDGRYKLVRWMSPLEYERPLTVAELYASSDVTLHDLSADPGEMQNLAHPEHPKFDEELVGRLLEKLNTLIEAELGQDERPFDLDMFGTRNQLTDLTNARAEHGGQATP